MQVTAPVRPNKMTAMKKISVGGIVLAVLLTAGVAVAQKDTAEEPTSWIHFSVIKDDNGKPIRNAAVVMHSVSEKGKQERGGMELKTNAEGKADFEGIPYGMLRVQVLAQGFQTYGEDFDIEKPNTEINIKLKRPQGQYSIYQDHPNTSNSTPKQDAPPPADPKKPN